LGGLRAPPALGFSAAARERRVIVRESCRSGEREEGLLVGEASSSEVSCGERSEPLPPVRRGERCGEARGEEQSLRSAVST